MSNAFSKEEVVAFEDVMLGFEDQLVLSKNVNTYNTDGVTMARANDTIWRPIPYIGQSFDGMDQTSNFSDYTQLSVPAPLGYKKSVPFIMDAMELRDALQENRLGQAAKQKLASDINQAIMTVAAYQGTAVVKRTTAASGFDDIAQCDALFNETGVPNYDRCIALSSRDYNGMANNLSVASRSFGNRKTDSAYERAYLGQVSSFDTFKMDYALSLTAKAGVTVTVNGANQYHTPAATSTAGTGEVSNVDNRTQSLIISVGGGTVKVGDAFTIANVYAVHPITKQSTGQLKTFRITAIVSGAGGSGTVTISPAIVSNGGSTDAEAQYQNVTATPANGAAITFLNTTTASMNPFWQKDAIEILPGRYAVDTSAGAAIMRSTTSQGIEVVMQKQYDINTMKYKFRFDCLFGVVNKQPEMSGIILFGQA